MNIAGVLVHAYPDQRETVVAEFEAHEGIELHHETDDGRFIITVADAGMTRCDDTILALQKAEGIACASLVYHNFEPDDLTQTASLAHSA